MCKKMDKTIKKSELHKFLNVRNCDYYIVTKNIHNSDAYFPFGEVQSQFVCNFIETTGIIFEDNMVPTGLIRIRKEDDIASFGLNKNQAYYVTEDYFKANNIYLYRKKKNLYQRKFIEKINYVKKVLKEKDIDINAVVITNGSALEAYGVRTAGDVDLIVHPNVRREIFNTDKRIELSEDIEIKPVNSYAYSDEKIIDNSNNYVMVQGVKFLSLELCFRHNYSLRRKKHNRKDLNLIMRYVLNSSNI